MILIFKVLNPNQKPDEAKSFIEIQMIPIMAIAKNIENIKFGTICVGTNNMAKIIQMKDDTANALSEPKRASAI
jgi:hypothetical protein